MNMDRHNSTFINLANDRISRPITVNHLTLRLEAAELAGQAVRFRRFTSGYKAQTGFTPRPETAMPQHPIASLFARLWGGSRAADTDAGDLGTAFGMEMSLLEAEVRDRPATAPAPKPGSRWLRRRGRIATIQGRN